MTHQRFSISSSTLRLFYVVGCALCMWTACGDSNDLNREHPHEVTDADYIDAPEDTNDSDATDTTTQDVEPDTTRPPIGSPVEVDLASYTDGGASLEDTVRVAQAATQDDLLTGESAQGQAGDYVLENGVVRAIVERNYRAMSPCPYGGNIIDSAAKLPDGSWGEDVLGEVCPLINAGLTFQPEEYRILQSGGEGQTGVLAVDGKLEVWDFLNLLGTAASFLGGVELNLALDPSRILPFKATIYYILRPGDRSVRVLTALRNDGDEREYTAMSHLLRSAGDGDFFNPLNGLGGFGYGGLGADSLNADPLPFLGYMGKSSGFFYTPQPGPFEREGIPVAGSHLAVSGVTVSLLGSLNLFEVILTPPGKLDETPGINPVDPGQTLVFDHWHVIADGRISSALDTAYPLLGVDTATLTGRVTDARGEPVSDLTVSAVRDGRRAMNVTKTDSDGRYSMQVPAGAYVLRARNSGLFAQSAELSITAGDNTTTDLQVRDGSTLRVSVTTPSGDPTPARITVLCDAECPAPPTSQDENISNNALPSGYAAIAYADPTGRADLFLQPGTYRVMVSRGMEWSIWPQDSIETRGTQITLTEGQEESLTAEIAPVIESDGVLSGDFHIHAIHSSDSPVRNEDRVMNFVSEGVDVMVSTDHDYITDFAPVIEQLGVDREVVSVIGGEITTSDLGHLNAFPLQLDPEDAFGGALDWSDGPNLGLTPKEIFEWINDQPGEQVIQINHPGGGLGTFTSLKVDSLLGTTRALAADVRLPEAAPEDKLDALDTGLWDEGYTAIEVMNGNGRGAIWNVMRWWMTMIGRGFTPTATAVTDTHNLYNDLGSAPRSMIFVPEDQDTPETFNEESFVASVNAGRLVATNGPFFRAYLVNSEGEEATFGDTLTRGSGTVRARVELQTPHWMKVDTLDVYINPREGIYEPDAKDNQDPIPPTLSSPIELTDDDLVEVATGTLTHRRYAKTVTIDLDIEEDAFVVFMLRGDGAQTPSMYPLLRGNTKPFAFSNPIYVDEDGGGYNTYPLADLVEERLAERAQASSKPTARTEISLSGHKGHNHADHFVVHTHGRTVYAWETSLDLIGAFIEYGSCTHE